MSQTALEWCCLRPSPRGAARLFGWPLALDMIGDNVRSRIVSVCLCLIVLVYYFYTSVLLLDSDNDRSRWCSAVTSSRRSPTMSCAFSRRRSTCSRARSAPPNSRSASRGPRASRRTRATNGCARRSSRRSVSSGARAGGAEHATRRSPGRRIHRSWMLMHPTDVEEDVICRVKSGHIARGGPHVGIEGRCHVLVHQPLVPHRSSRTLREGVASKGGFDEENPRGRR